MARFIRLGVLSVLLAFSVFVWTAVAGQERRELTVAFLDVGQGDAIFIEAPNGNQILIDGGRGRKLLSKLSAVMPFYDRSLDAVLATHPDADHIGGLPEVFSRYRIQNYFHSGKTSGTAAYKALSRAVRTEEGVHIQKLHRGQRIVLGAGAVLDVLYPNAHTKTEQLEANAASVVLLLSFGETSVLLTGDAPQRVEKHLAASLQHKLDADILKAGHHGSKTSTAGLFLGYVSPEYAVISAGADNRYGHPHEEVLARLRAFGSTIVNTAHEGSIVFTSNGARFYRDKI